MFTPTLTGLGERRHLLTPAVDVETHIRDVLGLLEAEELEDVVLAGHSYAGMVITAINTQENNEITVTVTGLTDATIAGAVVCLGGTTPAGAACTAAF